MSAQGTLTYNINGDVCPVTFNQLAALLNIGGGITPEQVCDIVTQDECIDRIGEALLINDAFIEGVSVIVEGLIPTTAEICEALTTDPDCVEAINDIIVFPPLDADEVCNIVTTAPCLNLLCTALTTDPDCVEAINDIIVFPEPPPFGLAFANYLYWDGTEYVSGGGLNGFIRLGTFAGQTHQGKSSIAIGLNAGNANQGKSSIAIGLNAGNANQGKSSIAIGSVAGTSKQGKLSIAIGLNAGNANQGKSSIAIGVNTGSTSQGTNAVAIGDNAATSKQGQSSVAIGTGAATSKQGLRCVAIGANTASSGQGNESIAIGAFAGGINQATRSIDIRASADAYTVSNSGLYISPIRKLINPEPSPPFTLWYNPTTREVCYNPGTV